MGSNIIIIREGGNVKKKINLDYPINADQNQQILETKIKSDQPSNDLDYNFKNYFMLFIGYVNTIRKEVFV